MAFDDVIACIVALRTFSWLWDLIAANRLREITHVFRLISSVGQGCCDPRDEFERSISIGPEGEV